MGSPNRRPTTRTSSPAGLAFAFFGLLIVAVIFLGFSLAKQLRKVDQAEEAGLYDPSDRKKKQQAEPAEDAGEE